MSDTTTVLKEMRIDDLCVNVESILLSLIIPYKKIMTFTGSCLYAIDVLGIVLNCTDRVDITVIDSRYIKNYKGWRCVNLNTFDNNEKIRNIILWSFMKSGYGLWVRTNYQKHFIKLLDEYGYSVKIINERLRLWSDLPCYKYYITVNKEALLIPVRRLLSLNPSFFDEMPDIDIDNRGYVIC